MPLTLWLRVCLLLGRIFPWETRRVQVELLGSVYLLCWLWGFQVRSPFPSRLFCVLIASFPFWPKISSTRSTHKAQYSRRSNWPAFTCMVLAAVTLQESYSLLLLHYLIFDTKLITKFSMNYFFFLCNRCKEIWWHFVPHMLFLASYSFLDLTQNFHLDQICWRLAWVLGLAWL